MVQGLGQVPWGDLEGTLNLGVGMVAVVAADVADDVQRAARELGMPAWVLGSVRPWRDEDATAADVVAGTKGVQGGAVRMHGTYRTA
jgi:phosphoribosylformylglycinamidine cyclo-ligase